MEDGWNCEEITAGGLVKCTHPDSNQAVFLGHKKGLPIVEIERVSGASKTAQPLDITIQKEIAIIDNTSQLPKSGDWTLVGTQRRYGKQVWLEEVD